MSHTSGPWEYSKEVSRVGIHMVNNKDGYLIANVGGYKIDPDANEANARLISAAPDLLMVLKNFYDHFKEPGCNPFMQARRLTPDDWNALVLGARAAIAKAEGK